MDHIYYQNVVVIGFIMDQGVNTKTSVLIIQIVGTEDGVLTYNLQQHLENNVIVNLAGLTQLAKKVSLFFFFYLFGVLKY